MEKEIFEKIAIELMEIREQQYEVADELHQAKEEGNIDSYRRLRRWGSKLHARFNQTIKIGEMIGFNQVEMENAAFDKSVEKVAARH